LISSTDFSFTVCHSFLYTSTLYIFGYSSDTISQPNHLNVIYLFGSIGLSLVVIFIHPISSCVGDVCFTIELIVLYTNLSLQVGESLYDVAQEATTCISLFDALVALEKNSAVIVGVTFLFLHQGIFCILPSGNHSDFGAI
jgi:hypothetical protein